MNRFFRTGTLVVLPLITLVLGWQLGMTFERKNVQDRVSELEFLYSGKTESGSLVHDPEQEVNLALMWGVWRLLLQHYIAPDKLQTTPMLYGATAGLVRALEDPYTAFMTPKENREFKEGLGGTLHGIGAELTLRNGQVVIVAPIKGSPAQVAGLQPEDIITAVNGEDIVDEPLNAVVQRIRGPKGTTVTLTIVRSTASAPLTFTIKRDDITVPSTQDEVRKTASGSVGIVTINQFGDGTIAEVEKVVRGFKNENVKGIIIDLRFNGGGYLEGAVELASLFLKQGKVVTVQRRQGEPVHHYVNGRPLEPDIPLAILINAGTASASEIFAGALQDLKRATVIGKKSFGKGTVQEVFDLPGGSSLRVTVARWLTPAGRDLGTEGVIPDLDVDRSPEDVAAERDPQMDAALRTLLKRETPAKSTSSVPQNSSSKSASKGLKEIQDVNQ